MGEFGGASSYESPSYQAAKERHNDPFVPPATNEYPPYHNRFDSSDFQGRDESGARPTYPPTDSWGSYEKGMNPVSRGSIAAQMAAEGQIPKKEGLRMWRTDEHAGALMRGGRGKCCLRVCGCSIVLVITILVSVIAAFLLWTRPPDITFNGVEAPSNGSEVSLQTNGFIINVNLNIGVINPNFFGVNFKSIVASASYPGYSNKLGGGRLDNFDIPKNSNTTIHFPFQVNYTTSVDSDLKIITDIATKCGFLGSSTSDLTVDYTLKLGIKVVGIVITPSFSSSVSFACPLSESDIEGLLGSSSLSSLLGGTSSKRELEVVHAEARRAIDKVMKRSWETVGGVKLLEA